MIYFFQLVEKVSSNYFAKFKKTHLDFQTNNQIVFWITVRGCQAKSYLTIWNANVSWLKSNCNAATIYIVICKYVYRPNPFSLILNTILLSIWFIRLSILEPMPLLPIYIFAISSTLSLSLCLCFCEYIIYYSGMSSLLGS